jgi:hypothetical protein
MNRLAADYYGVSRADLLDPVISLLLESLGEEIYRIAGNIDDMENRVLDKISSALISDIDLIAKPSHAVLHVSASDDQLLLRTDNNFECNFNAGRTEHKLSFFPVCNTKIYNGDIRYFIYEGLFFSVDSERNKTLLIRSGQKGIYSGNSFWIGLELDESISDIKNLSFYIDFAGIYNREQYLKQIPYMIWKNRSKQIPMQRGLFPAGSQQDNRVLDLFKAFDVSTRINNYVKREYDPGYLTVKGSFDISNAREIFPAELSGSFPDSFKQDFTKPLLWLEVTCPTQYTSDIINSLRISINTLPVICKKLVSRTIEVNRSVPVIPLYTSYNESFLSVHSLSDSTGKEYYEIPIKDTENNHYGIYSLRKGGCERYNVRDANEYLNFMADSLDYETSSLFKSKRELKTELKKVRLDLHAVVKDLRKTILNEKERLETIDYVFIDPEKSEEIYFIKYWVANFILGNTIRAGVSLKEESGLAVNPASIFLLTTTKEGCYAPRQSGRSGIFRKSLVKHPLLVTDEDIIEFCKREFAGVISQVSVSRSFIEENDPETGFVRTTDVHIVPVKNLEKIIGREDLEYFRQILAENSPATFDYRVLIS